MPSGLVLMLFVLFWYRKSSMSMCILQKGNVDGEDSPSVRSHGVISQHLSMGKQINGAPNRHLLTSNDTEILSFNEVTYLISEAPVLFSIISLTVRPRRVDQPQDYFYSVDVLVNCTCHSKHESNITLIFQSLSLNQSRNCLFLHKNHEFAATCDNLHFGVRYTIDGFALCDTRNISLSAKKELYELGKPRYLNSTRDATSIRALLFLPGSFPRLIIKLNGSNQTCSFENSLTHSPFYNCLFTKLSPAEAFVLSYDLFAANDQVLSDDLAIVYTELEDFEFSCHVTANNRHVEFFWTSLLASGYENLTIIVSNEDDKATWTIECNPYLHKEACSTGDQQLEACSEYRVTAKLRKLLVNYSSEKTGQCSMKTNINPTPIGSIRHELVNETTVRLTWETNPCHVQVQLENLETNVTELPVVNERRMALFVNLTEATAYQVRFNISKVHWDPFIQTPKYYIRTDFRKPIIESVVRSSDDALIVNARPVDRARIKVIYCIQQAIDFYSKHCSTSNRFSELKPGSIYNVSITIYRGAFHDGFAWENRTTFKLVDTNPTRQQVRAWRDSERCAVELTNAFQTPYKMECMSHEGSLACDQLRCGCRYQLRILFDQAVIQSLCSKSDCDIRWGRNSSVYIPFQTPLESIEDLRIVSVSPLSRQIQVEFNRPVGCYDQFVLICEAAASRQRLLFIDSTTCTGLRYDEFYRVFVEIKRAGWESAMSNVVEARLVLTDEVYPQKQGVQPVLVSLVVVVLLTLMITVFVVFGLLCRNGRWPPRSQRGAQQTTHVNNLSAATKLNAIVNQVNIFSNSAQTCQEHLKGNIIISRPIRIENLPQEYERLIANNFYNVSDEFQKLQRSLQQVPQAVQCNQPSKNRYKDIVPYEHTRVKLAPVDECDPGYINANFISGLHSPREYIACQGPLKSTVNDHWRMIWEQSVMIIVMLTELVEHGVNKCERYWPLNLGEVETFGKVSACVKAYIKLNAYELRHIELSKDAETRSIKHFAFKMWDDHTTPTNSDALVNFIRLVRAECRLEHHGPILIHCSAGVGRSGTFIALDCLLQQFDRLSPHDYLDVYGTVFSMRQCRDKMVQNEHQYLFIYRCLREEYEKTSKHFRQ